MSSNSDLETLGTVAGCGAIVVLTPILVVLSYLINGYVLSMLWKWFIVTTFHLPVLNIPEAIGIAVVVGFLTKQITSSGDSKEKSKSEKWTNIIGLIIGIFVGPFITLLIGWIVYSTYFVH